MIIRQLNIDAGMYSPNSGTPLPPLSIVNRISGNVWDDSKTPDGLRNSASDAPIAGVQVWAGRAGTGRASLSTRTNAQGYSEFVNVRDDKYQVQFALPGQSDFTLFRQGTNPAVDSDVAVATTFGVGWSIPVTISKT